MRAHSFTNAGGTRLRCAIFAAVLTCAPVGALACRDLKPELKVESSDVTVVGVAVCERARAECILTASQVLKAQPESLREILKNPVVVKPEFAEPEDPSSDEFAIRCSHHWIAEDGRYDGTFYLEYLAEGVFAAPYWPMAEKL